MAATHIWELFMACCIMKPVQVRLCKQRVQPRRGARANFCRSCVVPCLRSSGAVRIQATALPSRPFCFRRSVRGLASPSDFSPRALTAAPRTARFLLPLRVHPISIIKSSSLNDDSCETDSLGGFYAARTAVSFRILRPTVEGIGSHRSSSSAGPPRKSKVARGAPQQQLF